MSEGAQAVFITGGGSGLGAAVARLLAAGGWRVGIAGRRRAPLDEVAQRAMKTYALDVADAGAVENAVRDFQPDALVCAAAILGRGDVFEDLTPELFAQVMAINVLLPFAAAAGVAEAAAIFERLPGEPPNRVVRYMAAQLGAPGVRFSGACHQQGLLHLFHLTCAARECERCPARGTPGATMPIGETSNRELLRRN